MLQQHCYPSNPWGDNTSLCHCVCIVYTKVILHYKYYCAGDSMIKSWIVWAENSHTEYQPRVELFYWWEKGQGTQGMQFKQPNFFYRAQEYVSQIKKPFVTNLFLQRPSAFLLCKSFCQGVLLGFDISLFMSWVKNFQFLAVTNILLKNLFHILSRVSWQLKSAKRFIQYRVCPSTDLLECMEISSLRLPAAEPGNMSSLVSKGLLLAVGSGWHKERS